MIETGLISITRSEIMNEESLDVRSRISVSNASASMTHDLIQIPLDEVMEYTRLNESVSSTIPFSRREEMSTEQQFHTSTLQNHISEEREALEPSNE